MLASPYSQNRRASCGGKSRRSVDRGLSRTDRRLNHGVEGPRQIAKNGAMPDHITVEDLMRLRTARVSDADATAYRDGAVVRTDRPSGSWGREMTESRKDELLRRYGMGSSAARDAMQRKLCGAATGS